MKKILKTVAKVAGVAIIAIVAVEIWDRLAVSERIGTALLKNVPAGFLAAEDAYNEWRNDKDEVDDYFAGPLADLNENMKADEATTFAEWRKTDHP